MTEGLCAFVRKDTGIGFSLSSTSEIYCLYLDQFSPSLYLSVLLAQPHGFGEVTNS